MKHLICISMIALLACSNSKETYKPDLSTVTSSVAGVYPTPFIGFGYNQWIPDLKPNGEPDFNWSDDRFAMMEERIRAIHPGLVRMPVERHWYDPDLVPGNYNWESPEMKAFYKFMDLYKQMGVKVLSGWWHVTTYEDDKNGYKNDANVQAFAEFIDYMINTKGYTNIVYMQPSNEPYGTYTTYDDWSAFMRKTYDYCVLNSYPTDRLCGPDSWDDWVGKGAQYNSRELVSYNFHFYFDGTASTSENLGLYDALMGQMNQVIPYNAANKPVVCAECGAINGNWLDWPANKPADGIYSSSYQYALYMVDFAIQTIQAGIASSLSWGLHGFDQNKDAGMWNNTGNWGGTKLRPLYYAWSMLCRYFPDGAVCLNMSQETAKIKVGGCKVGSSDYTFVICNRATYAEKVTIDIPADSKKTYYFYHFNESNPGDGNSLSLPYTELTAGSTLAVEIHKNSAGFLTTLPPLE